jgi:RNA polymerase sigma factor (sigma-70 family)
MASAYPTELNRILAATDGRSRDSAWDDFAVIHSRLLLNTARSLTRDHDVAMDSYAHILGALRADQFRRLREYVPDAQTKFTTWLVVVARRLCLDFLRHRYGRSAKTEDGVASGERRTRGDLVDLVSSADPDHQPTPAHGSSLEADEIRRALADLTNGLEVEDRLLLKLRFDDGLSAPEIARLLGFPTPFHVYRRLNALYARLRGGLRERGIEEGEA